MIFYDDYHDNAPTDKGANMSDTQTPISDLEALPHFCGVLAVPLPIARELERKLRDTQAKLDAITVGFFPTQDQLREWEQRWQTAQKEHVCKSEASLSHRLSEINSLRAHNDKLYADYINECILRHEAEAAVCRARLAIASLEAKCNAETERCTKIAREYGLSPVMGKTIAALIMEGR